MSKKHPIIAVTGSSGAGTTSTTDTFNHIFHQLKIHAACITGDSFHRFTRAEMDVAIKKAQENNRNISYFGAEANNFERLAQCFSQYAQNGTGEIRDYLHTFEDAVPFNQMPGTFTQWKSLPKNTDLMFYEGLHGGVVTENIDIAQHVDLLIGMVPIVNLEWIQKIVRDTSERGHTREKVMDSIVRSMDDYINHMTPQFSRTHINFQRVPTIDTSNPFSAKKIPTLDESFVVIRFRGIENVDFPYYLSMINGAFMSRNNTMVVPGGKMSLAMELILTPLIKTLINKSANPSFSKQKK